LKPPSNEQRKWTRKIVEKWRPRLFLGEWFIDLNYQKEDIDSDSRPMATCKADPVYMQATIKIYPCFWDHSEYERAHALVHEMIHCHTQSVWNCMLSLHQGELIVPDQMRCEIEQLTQRISNIAFCVEGGE
jgi:hypothetical protein